MTVDEYHKKYGQGCFDGFFGVGNLAGVPAIPVDLYDMILDTVVRLNKIYIPFTSYWVMGHKPQLRDKISEVEDNIHVAVLCGDGGWLGQELEKYYEVWVEALGEFSTQREKYVPF